MDVYPDCYAYMRPTLVNPWIVCRISSRSTLLSNILLECDLDECFFEILGAQRRTGIVCHDAKREQIGRRGQVGAQEEVCVSSTRLIAWLRRVGVPDG